MSTAGRGEIVLEDVHKSFRVYHSRALKDGLVRLMKGQPLTERREILRGVDLRIGRGERVGLIGRNGAGKSTLFRLMSRILNPERGGVSCGGRIAPVIELAAGFVPDLSGEENLVLNAAVLGLSRREIAKRKPVIAEFAGLEEHLEMPVRYYSAGMQARLGFSVAVHADADILLVDEALAVGDQWFQQRCMERMRSLADAGVTIVFVSHEMAAVRSFCQRAVWLEEGLVREDGRADDVVDAYTSARGELIETSGA